MSYLSTKTWGHDVGLSACFRQWRAGGHCRFLHGYALSITVKFSTSQLDEKNWVIDFGSLKDLKNQLADTFDHKTVVGIDDPELSWFREGHEKGCLDLVVVPAVGCEKFAELVAGMAQDWLVEKGHAPRCWVSEVEVREHGANSAIYRPSHD